jgi:hypothetical protein
MLTLKSLDLLVRYLKYTCFDFAPVFRQLVVITPINIDIVTFLMKLYKNVPINFEISLPLPFSTHITMPKPFNDFP